MPAALLAVGSMSSWTLSGEIIAAGESGEGLREAESEATGSTMAQVTCNMASNLASCRLHPSTSASRTGQYRPKNYSVGENERFSVTTAIIGGLGARIGLCAIRNTSLARGCRGATQVSSREHQFQQTAEYQHQLPEPQPSRSSKPLHCVQHAKQVIQSVTVACVIL